MKRILITGSQGLIGKGLSKYLEAKGILLRVLDKKIPFSQEGSGDILDKTSLEKAVQGCQGVIHLAGVSRVVFGQQDPEA